VRLKVSLDNYNNALIKDKEKRKIAAIIKDSGKRICMKEALRFPNKYGLEIIKSKLTKP